MKNIQIQKSNSTEQETIEIEKNMVIVGANGAGKSRLGSKLEQINSPTKRISAQRYLQLAEAVQKQNFETAKNQLNDSYKNKPPIQPQNDYQQVLISLFAQEAQRNEEVVNTIKLKGKITKKQTPASIKEEVIAIWDFVFPYRKLNLENDKVRADGFSGTEMSDGEKVGLYLISQILLAEKNCTLIIDEPELHLHKSLMVRLWNKLEEYRSDCAFIYITHDLDFAVSKASSKLIWMKSYSNNIWIWEEINQNGIIPENLFLEVLGSREDILFVEGEKGSLDIQIYQAYYENFTIIPRGSYEKVIEAVKGLRNNTALHHKKVYGLIDRDFHLESKLNSWKRKKVFSIPVNKVENIFLLPEVIDIVCQYLEKVEKKDEIIAEIRMHYKKNKAKISFRASKDRMHRHIGECFGLIKSKKGYEKFKKSIFTELDNLAAVSLPNHDAELLEILNVLPHKGLTTKIQRKLELSGNEYRNLVLNFLISTDKRKPLIKILKKYLPEIK